jgi:hypothetical protein
MAVFRCHQILLPIDGILKMLIDRWHSGYKPHRLKQPRAPAGGIHPHRRNRRHMYENSHDSNHHIGERQVSNPPAWLSTVELEDELLAAIQASGCAQSSALTMIDEYFSGDDEFEQEEKHRQILLWLLSLLRPRLANLLGGPPTA